MKKFEEEIKYLIKLIENNNSKLDKILSDLKKEENYTYKIEDNSSISLINSGSIGYVSNTSYKEPDNITPTTDLTDANL